MTDFKIRRGLSSILFSEPGVINPKLIIEEGCWYLCTDTAELYLGAAEETGELTLKRINGVASRPTTTPVPDQNEKTILAVELDSDNNLVFSYSDDSINIIELPEAIVNTIKGAGYATASFVKAEIAKAQLAGADVDLSSYATKEYVTEQLAENKLTILDGGNI